MPHRYYVTSEGEAVAARRVLDDLRDYPDESPQGATRRVIAAALDAFEKRCKPPHLMPPTSQE